MDYVQGGQSWQFFSKFQRKSPTSPTCFRRLTPTLTLRTLSVRASRFRTGRDHIKATVGRALSTIRRALPSFVTPQPI